MSEKFSCKICKYTTKHIGNYNKHCNTLKHHQKVVKSIPEPSKTPKIVEPPPPPQKFPHLCGNCGKKYSRKDALKRHQSSCFDVKSANTLNTLNTFGAQNKILHINKFNTEEKKIDTSIQKVLRNSRLDSVEYNDFSESTKLHNFLCKLCKKKYSTKMDFLEHQANCSRRKNVENVENVDIESIEGDDYTSIETNKDVLITPQNALKIEKYKNKLIQKNIIISSKDELLEHYKQELNYMRGMLDTAGGMANKAVGSLTHIVNNYENAPPLEKAKISHVLKIKNINNSYKNKKEKEMMIIEQVFSEYNHGTIGQYIGDIIISMYKKKDPELQSMWATDTSRLTYLIKKQENKNSRWVVDKKGVETMKYVIDPIIQKIKELARMYLDNNPPIKYDDISSIDMEKIATIEKTYMSLINDIDDRKIHQKVLKYISSHFYFDKSKNVSKKL
jgi:hypothetical protein